MHMRHLEATSINCRCRCSTEYFQFCTEQWMGPKNPMLSWKQRGNILSFLLRPGFATGFANGILRPKTKIRVGRITTASCERAETVQGSANYPAFHWTNSERFSLLPTSNHSVVLQFTKGFIPFTPLIYPLFRFCSVYPLCSQVHCLGNANPGIVAVLPSCVSCNALQYSLAAKNTLHEE